MAKQGIKLVVIGSILEGAAFAVLFFGLSKHHNPLTILGGIIFVLAALFTAFCVYFFRDPERPIPTDMSLLYSPGQGRVLSVAEEIPGIKTIRIFLSVWDVHVQRSPCSGVVKSIVYQPGTFKAAMVDAARQNERSITTISPEGRPDVVVEQIAGLVARRIETWPKQGERLTAGQRYGIIYFGSQAAVHCPKGCEPIVKPGDRVVVGLTPIAKWTS
jgi:phosphatidylserine decarboxylase